jgi:hypothetical protein
MCQMILAGHGSVIAAAMVETTAISNILLSLSLAR